jgi:hypothetical protein
MVRYSREGALSTWGCVIRVDVGSAFVLKGITRILSRCPDFMCTYIHSSFSHTLCPATPVLYYFVQFVQERDF